MSPSLDQIKNSLSGLPVSERAELAHFLLETLEPEDEGVADAWRAGGTRIGRHLLRGSALRFGGLNVWPRFGPGRSSANPSKRCWPDCEGSFGEARRDAPRGATIS